MLQKIFVKVFGTNLTRFLSWLHFHFVSHEIINPFDASGLFLHTLEISKNLKN